MTSWYWNNKPSFLILTQKQRHAWNSGRKDKPAKQILLFICFFSLCCRPYYLSHSLLLIQILKRFDFTPKICHNSIREWELCVKWIRVIHDALSTRTYLYPFLTLTLYKYRNVVGLKNEIFFKSTHLISFFYSFACVSITSQRFSIQSLMLFSLQNPTKKKKLGFIYNTTRKK